MARRKVINPSVGPWKAIGTFVGTDDEDSQTIGYASDHRNDRPTPLGEREANAKLFAASYDLLKVAVEALDWCREDRMFRNDEDSESTNMHNNRCKLLEEAIARARYYEES